MPSRLPISSALLAALLASASCASPPPREAALESLPARPEARDRAGEEIVALIDGKPVTARAVADRVLELDPKAAVDQYVRWKVIEDRRAELGIVNAPAELRRRAELYAGQLKRQSGEAGFRARLAAEGTTEEAYVAQLAGSRFLDQMLTMDKIVRYQAMTEDTLEIDRMAFVDEGDAKRFAEAAKAKGFDAASEELLKGGRSPRYGRLPRESFPPSSPPASPALDPWVVEALLKLKPGELTGVESSRSNLYYVVRLAAFRPARRAAYGAAREEVLESVFRDPPQEADYRAWIDRAFSRTKVEYRAPRKEGGR
jgi:hypothetical protein